MQLAVAKPAVKQPTPTRRGIIVKSVVKNSPQHGMLESTGSRIRVKGRIYVIIVARGSCFLMCYKSTCGIFLCLNITKNGAKVEAKKDLESQITIQNGTLVDNLDSIEDLEPSSIKYLLKEMKKGSMQREFPIERHPESFFQVPFSFSFFTFFYFQLQSCNMQVASDPHSLINGHRGTLFFICFLTLPK